MKTQISRHSHRPAARYSGVYQQQGRMITDADWNELVEIVKARVDDALADVVGRGAPREGGVQVVRKPDSSLWIEGRTLYAGGVRARVAPTDEAAASAFSYLDQADLPNAIAPKGDYRVYVDIWERPVSSLEDSELRDPALHGADTTTRTRTMAQIKWCPRDRLPEEPADNPPRGDAVLSLTLRASDTERDPDDPCATVVEVDRQVGDYLFRVEIHDVPRAENQHTLTVKWSRENGAEQYCLSNGEPPPGFAHASWAYELFDNACEKHLGVHLAPGFVLQRGVLLPAYPQTPSPELDLIRRWDGYCRLKKELSGWSFAEGQDRGEDLFVGSGGHGAVAVSAEALEIQLEELDLTLVFGDKLVAGDYWLAPVRQAQHQPGNTILEPKPPLGIVHHYLELEVLPEEAPDTARAPRLRFPRLTELQAEEIAYSGPSNCDNKLFPANDEALKTVKQALDRLCGLQAHHVRLGDCQPCAGSHFKFGDEPPQTVADALRHLCHLQAHHVGVGEACTNSLFAVEKEGFPPTTVEDALKLLCNVRARNVRYTAGCESLGDAQTVEQALDTLCKKIERRDRWGCLVIVPIIFWGWFRKLFGKLG